MSTKVGKKYLDKNGLSYFRQKLKEELKNEQLWEQGENIDGTEGGVQIAYYGNAVGEASVSEGVAYNYKKSIGEIVPISIKSLSSEEKTSITNFIGENNNYNYAVKIDFSSIDEDEDEPIVSSFNDLSNKSLNLSVCEYVDNTENISISELSNIKSIRGLYKDSDIMSIFTDTSEFSQLEITNEDNLEWGLLELGDISVNKDSTYIIGISTGAFGIASHSEGYYTTTKGNYSHSEGIASCAKGIGSHAEGDNSHAEGDNSHAEGKLTTASGTASHAEGNYTNAIGDYSHAEGYGPTASGIGSHAEGLATTAKGEYSHSEGDSTNAIGNCSHAEGNVTTASGTASHAEGDGSQAKGECSHAEGASSVSEGGCSHSEGLSTTAKGEGSHAEGDCSRAEGYASHAEGGGSVAKGNYSHTEGAGSITEGDYSHAEGDSTKAQGIASHAEGYSTTAQGYASHAEGSETKATNLGAHAEGSGTTASGSISHAEGQNTIASGDCSHAEGYYKTTASGKASHAEGSETTAANLGAHSEGRNSKAYGNASHAEGNGSVTGKQSDTANNSTNFGYCSHAEGFQTEAIYNYSHTEGYKTKANHVYSHAEGYQTITNGEASHTEGINCVTGGSAAANNLTAGTLTEKGHYAHAEGNANIAYGNASHAEGKKNFAGGKYSHAEGNVTSTGTTATAAHAEGSQTNATGSYSHAEGKVTTASGEASHAEGYTTSSIGYYSHSEGDSTKAEETASHAEGQNTIAAGISSHAEGFTTSSIGIYSHAEGRKTTSYSSYSHTEGNSTITYGKDSHAEGSGFLSQEIKYQIRLKDPNNKTDYTYLVKQSENFDNLKEGTILECNSVYRNIKSVTKYNAVDSNGYEGEIVTNSSLTTSTELVNAKLVYGIAFGDHSHSEGNLTTAVGESSHSEGRKTLASGNYSHTEGNVTIASGTSSHAEGSETKATNLGAHSEGRNTVASGNASHAEGNFTTAQGYTSHTEGDSTTAEGDCSHAEGLNTTAEGGCSHAEGEDTVASGDISHAEGEACIASGYASHAEGMNTVASGIASHAEGSEGCTASGAWSHAEGSGTTASGEISHAEGGGTVASGSESHAEGQLTKAVGHQSHAEGTNTIATNNSEHAEGKFNKSNTGTISSIGIGTSDTNRKNAFEVMQNGDMYVYGLGDYDGTNPGTALTLQECINTDKLPQKENELIYFDEKDGFISKQLLLQDENIIIDNQEDFDLCTNISDIETNVLGSWQQFTDNKEYSPEYGNGKYIFDDNDTSAGLGYGRWYLEGSKILNPMNSDDFNGYMIPFAKSSYSIESIIGTNIGNTTGDNIGFSIVNDKNAIPKYVETESGRIYYRNTLYDILQSNATSSTPQRPLKSAWVCEDRINNTAYVIYVNSSTTTNIYESYPIIYREYEGIIKGEYNVYLIDNIKTSAGRKKYESGDLEDSPVFTERIKNFVNASGVIDFVTVTVTNSSDIQLGHGTSGTNNGTIYVFGSRYNISECVWTNQLVFSGNVNKLGRELVAFDENLDTNTHPCVIKTLTDFNNGILTVNFSDAISDVESAKTAQYNNSELKIDFNNRKYFITTINDSDVKTVYEQYLPEDNSIDNEFWKGFSEKTKFMYHAYSYQNLYIECLNILMDNKVIWVHNNGINTEYGLKSDRKGYEIKGNVSTKDILSGSRLAYNPITKKLFYSNGDIIYQIASSSVDNSSGDSGSNSSGDSGDSSSQSFTLNPATKTKLGGIKVGSNLSITDKGTLTAKGYVWDDETNTMTITSTSEIPGKIEASGGFFETSDARKKDVQGELSLDKAYDFIRNCEPILYNLKGSDKTQIGLIAQEVQEFFPEIVNEDEEGYLSLDYAKLTVVILRVLKDLIDKK